jgi:glycosyltransferase involved in cell wall biosynthesis
MRAILDAIPDAGYAGRESDAYQEYLPRPAHRKRAAIAAPSGAALTGVCGGLIRDMVQRGHHVLAFAPGLSSKDMRLLSQMGATPYSLPTELAFLDKYRRMRELSTILADAAPEVMLVQSARNGATSVAAAKIARIPKVVTVVPELGPAFMEGAGATAWGERQAMKAMYRAVFAWSDAVIFHSPHDRDYVRERSLLSKSKTHFIVGGWGEDLRRNMQRELPPLDRGLLFIMAAPLDRLQGVLEYCEAARAMRQKSRRARFFLASTPGAVVSPLSAADLKPYREFVQYIGPIADSASAVARCHAVVAPSYGNGAPRSLYQALAVGRPVIATDTRSCRDFVRQGLNGYRVAVRDPGSVARAMTQILQRPDLLPSMAQESRRLALRFCDVSSVNTLLLETLGL